MTHPPRAVDAPRCLQGVAMSTATATRLPSAPTWAPRRAVASLVTLGVLAGGAWGLLQPRDTHGTGHARSGSAAVATVQLPDGTLRVDGLVDKQVGHVMPGMSTPEDVPAGMRRVSVNVSLGATQGEPLSYDRRDFTVSGPGVAPVAPVAGQIDNGQLAAGKAISGSLSFDVPESATSLSLRFGDTEPVPLPALPAMSDGAGHGADHGSGATAPGATTPAATAPDAAGDSAGEPDHPHAPGAAPHDH